MGPGRLGLNNMLKAGTLRERVLPGKTALFQYLVSPGLDPLFKEMAC